VRGINDTDTNDASVGQQRGGNSGGTDDDEVDVVAISARACVQKALNCVGDDPGCAVPAK
jgi:hypothetical protein